MGITNVGSIYHITIVAIGHGLLKKFWPMVIGCVLRTVVEYNLFRSPSLPGNYYGADPDQEGDEDLVSIFIPGACEFDLPENSRSGLDL